jgi:hypothetical protein
MYRIISGEYNINFCGKQYLIKQPTFDIKKQAKDIYNQTIEQNRFNHWISEKQGTECCIKCGLLSKTYENDLKVLCESLDDNKLDLYLSYTNSKKQNSIRGYLQYIRENISKIENILGYIRGYTIEGYAASRQFEFILFNTIYADDHLIYNDESSTSNYSLFGTALNSLFLTPEDFKLVARSNSWNMYWKHAANPFPSFAYLTDEQQYLLHYSKLYDNVRKHPECPNDDIINDDDMLDGWLIKQRKDIEEDQQEKRNESLYGGRGEEIFIPAQTEEDKRRISNMNTLQARMIKQQREQVIKQKGSAKDIDLLDNKLTINQQINKAIMDTKHG